MAPEELAVAKTLLLGILTDGRDSISSLDLSVELLSRETNGEITMRMAKNAMKLFFHAWEFV
jgi:hypothetical protein